MFKELQITFILDIRYTSYALKDKNIFQNTYCIMFSEKTILCRKLLWEMINYIAFLYYIIGV